MSSGLYLTLQCSSLWFLMCKQSIVFLTSFHMYFCGPGRGSDVLATAKLSKWHILSWAIIVLCHAREVGGRLLTVAIIRTMRKTCAARTLALTYSIANNSPNSKYIHCCIHCLVNACFILTDRVAATCPCALHHVR